MLVNKSRRYLIAMCGIGSDSHSVGLLVLRKSLENAGFDVAYMGIQNSLDSVKFIGKYVDAVLISVMDGQAPLYLPAETELNDRCLWYLGGNPVLTEDKDDHLDHIGFRRIYRSFVSSDTVIEHIHQDLSTRPVNKHPIPISSLRAFIKSQQPLLQDPDYKTREEVLNLWPTGALIPDIKTNANYLRNLPLLSELSTSEPLVQPRSGVAGVAQQRALFLKLRAAGADVLSFQVDSLTRCTQYEQAQKAIDQHQDLNGFPLVNHGLDAIKEVTAGIGVPIQTRHSAREPRLLAELSYAGGASAFEGGAICYNIPYYADLSLTTSISRWQYVDNLTGQYADEGIHLDREFFGTLTATLLPPVIPIVTNILETLLAAKEGVRSVSLAYAEQGCRYQDIAALQVMEKLAKEYCSQYATLTINIVLHQFMGAFPQKLEDANHLIAESAKTAKLASVHRVVIKTTTESTSIPPAEANAQAIQLVNSQFRHAWKIDEKPLQLEAVMIEKAARHCLDHILSLKNNDLAGCIVAAFSRGLIDVPFSPSRFNNGQLLSIRDSSGAIRIVNPGDVQLPNEYLKYERQCLAERLSNRNLCLDNAWKLIPEDVLVATHGDFQWPLDEKMTSRKLAIM